MELSSHQAGIAGRIAVAAADGVGLGLAFLVDRFDDRIGGLVAVRENLADQLSGLGLLLEVRFGQRHFEGLLEHAVVAVGTVADFIGVGVEDVGDAAEFGFGARFPKSLSPLGRQVDGESQ